MGGDQSNGFLGGLDVTDHGRAARPPNAEPPVGQGIDARYPQDIWVFGGTAEAQGVVTGEWEELSQTGFRESRFEEWDDARVRLCRMEVLMALTLSLPTQDQPLPLHLDRGGRLAFVSRGRIGKSGPRRDKGALRTGRIV